MRRLGSVFRRKRLDDLPSGTLTFLLTDVEGSTRLWEIEPDGMERAVPRHIELIQQAVDSSGGILVRERGEGDSTFSVFTDARGAIRAALSAQRALHAEAWPDRVDIRVRFALHTGDATFADGEYTAPDINRCARIRALGAGGQTLMSERTADLVRGALPDGATLKDLGTHRLRDLSRPERISQLSHPDLPDEFPILRSLDVTPHNLPIQLTSFIGREEEVNRTKKLLQTSRMVTLTGSGGLGKTRLALQVGADLIDQFGDGIWFVGLARVTDPALVPATVATALSLRDEPGRTTEETLVAYLRDKHSLLILDNCEHLASATASLADVLLSGSAELSILATSQVTLDVAGATHWPLPPMELPTGEAPTPDDVSAVGSVRLFCERAALRNPSFVLTRDNVRDVVEICRRVEGIPLAVELAAAHVNILSPAEIAKRLEDRFRLLTGGPGGDPRHSTLRATLDWSYGLLGAAERLLLGRLSVFVGGFSLGAVEAVCSGDGLADDEVLDVLRTLVDSSLVLSVEAPDEVRFAMLETVREYAAEQRSSSGDTHPTEENHFTWYLDLAQATAGADGADEGVVLDRLERELDNFRAALDRSLPGSVRLASSLFRFWEARAHWAEGRSRLEALIGSTGEGTRDEASARRAIGLLATRQGELAIAREHLEAALRTWRDLNDPTETARALIDLGSVLDLQADREGARRACEEARSIAESISDDRLLMLALNGLGITATRAGDYQQAAELFDRVARVTRKAGTRLALARVLFNLAMCRLSLGDTSAAELALEEAGSIAREVGDRELEAGTLSALGGVAEDELDLDRASWLHDRAATIQRELDDQIGLANSLTRLGDVSRHRGDLDRASELIAEALEIWRRVGVPDGIVSALFTKGAVSRAAGRPSEARMDLVEALSLAVAADRKRAIAVCLEGIAGVLVDDDEHEAAAKLLGAAQRIRDEIAVQVPASDEVGYVRDRERIREALGDRADALLGEEAPSTEDAVALALSQPNSAL